MRLYANAQRRFMLINNCPFFKNLIKATIFSRFSDKIITSAALMLSYDLALILTPICASWRQGTSLRPKLMYIYHHQPS